MNSRQWQRLKKGDLVTPNKMARTDTGIRCVVEDTGRYPSWGYICIRTETDDPFPNGYRIRFLSYKCLDLLKE